MVSSTFTDLQEHRAALIDSIHSHKLHANVMENDSARLVDIIDSSLQMVRDSAAYIGVISLKYGQTPECPKRNPSQLSITELEFNEAQRLGRPILLYIMDDEYLAGKAGIERDGEKEKKLDAFRERDDARTRDDRRDFGHALIHGTHPARRENVDIRGRIAPLQQCEQGLADHGVAHPRGRDDQNAGWSHSGLYRKIRPVAGAQPLVW